MADLISRQAAIALMCRALHHNYEEGYAVTQMLELPSAQQWIPVTERLPYIDRDALKNLTVKKNGIWDSISDSFGRGLSEIIDSIPTADVVEVVRCKDCKHKEIEQPGMVYCPMMVGSWVADDHFCKWGERREDV